MPDSARTQTSRNLTKIGMFACMVSLALAFVQGWTRSKASIDLIQYVMPSRLWLQNLNPYDVGVYTENVHRQVVGANYWFYACPSPPHLLLTMAPIASFTWDVTNKIWWVVSFLSLALSLWLLTDLFGAKWTPIEKYLFVALMAQSRLVQSVAYRGQVSLFILALALGALWCAQRGKRTLAGLLLGIACIKYTLALPLVLWLLWKRDFRTLGWAAFVVMAGSLIASLRIGIGVVLHTMPHSLSYFSKNIATEVERNYHITQWMGIYTTIFGRTSTTAMLLNAITAVAVIGTFVAICMRSKGPDLEGWVLASASMFSLTIVYHRVYDSVFVFIVAAAFWNLLRDKSEQRRPLTFIFGAVLFVFLFVVSAQNIAETLSVKLGAITPALIPVNAWLAGSILIMTLWTAYHRSSFPSAVVSVTDVKSARNVDIPVA